MSIAVRSGNEEKDQGFYVTNTTGLDEALAGVEMKPVFEPMGKFNMHTKPVIQMAGSWIQYYLPLKLRRL